MESWREYSNICMIEGHSPLRSESGGLYIDGRWLAMIGRHSINRIPQYFREVIGDSHQPDHSKILYNPPHHIIQPNN